MQASGRGCALYKRAVYSVQYQPSRLYTAQKGSVQCQQGLHCTKGHCVYNASTVRLLCTAKTPQSYCHRCNVTAQCALESARVPVLHCTGGTVKCIQETLQCTRLCTARPLCRVFTANVLCTEVTGMLCTRLSNLRCSKGNCQHFNGTVTTWHCTTGGHCCAIH